MPARIHNFAVDDDEDDSLLLEEAFCQLAECLVLEIYRTGPALLQRLGTLAPQEYPNLILMDMNLPGQPGQDVLRKLKADRPISLISVLILTGSDDAALLRMNELGTNAILHVSADFDELLSTVYAINDFWLRSAWLPVTVLKTQDKAGWGTA